MARSPKNAQNASKTGTGLVQLPASGKWFKNEDHVVQNFFVTVPQAHGKEVITNPQYWAHHARRTTPMSMIVCVDELKRWEIWLRVLEVGQTFLRVAPVHSIDYEVKSMTEQDAELIKAGFRVEERGENGWRVVDINNKVLQEGLLSQGEANAFVESHIRKMHAPAG